MRAFGSIALALAGLLLLPAIGAAQDNEQTIVLGGTLLGVQTFSKTDEVRDAAFVTDKDTAGAGHLFIEWYAFGNVGIGYRVFTLFKQETVTVLSVDYDTELSGDGGFFTLHWIPYIAQDRYTRVGVLYGAGSMNYELTLSGGGTDQTYSTDGSAQLAQIYLDWGAEDFGARFGFGHLSTNLDPMDTGGPVPLEADASGNHVFLDLRWAFQ